MATMAGAGTLLVELRDAESNVAPDPLELVRPVDLEAVSIAEQAVKELLEGRDAGGHDGEVAAYCSPQQRAHALPCEVASAAIVHVRLCVR